MWLFFVFLICAIVTRCVNQTATESREKRSQTEIHPAFAFIRASALNINNQGLICLHSTRTHKGLDRRYILNVQHSAGMLIFLLFIDMYVLIKNKHTHTHTHTLKPRVHLWDTRSIQSAMKCGNVCSEASRCRHWASTVRRPSARQVHVAGAQVATLPQTIISFLRQMQWGNGQNDWWLKKKKKERKTGHVRLWGQFGL